MRIGVILTGFFTLVLSGFVAAHFLMEKPVEKDYSEEEKNLLKTVDKEQSRPKIAEKGPFPKAVMDEVKFNFGRMQTAETRTHKFTIRNEGEAPLEVVVGHSACQCTVGEVPKEPIAPQATAEVSISWTPKVETEAFNKSIEIWTNDPEKSSILLTIDGMVMALLAAVPANLWEIPQFREGTTSEVTGILASQVAEKFSVLEIESGDPHVTAEWEVLDSQSDLDTIQALSAYKINVSIRPDMPVGEFNVPLTIKTDLKTVDGAPAEQQVMIRGNRQGPIRISSEKSWVANRSTVVLGTFDSLEGRKVVLTMVVLQPPAEGLKFTEAGVTSDPPELVVSLAPDEKSKGKIARYLLTIEYPPGAPRINRSENNPGKIKLHTNHPLAPEVELQVMFIAT
jgi:hypothetical protein